MENNGEGVGLGWRYLFCLFPSCNKSDNQERRPREAEAINENLLCPHGSEWFQEEPQHLHFVQRSGLPFPCVSQRRNPWGCCEDTTIGDHKGEGTTSRGKGFHPILFSDDIFSKLSSAVGAGSTRPVGHTPSCPDGVPLQTGDRQETTKYINK